MRLKPDTAGMTVMLAALIAVGPLSTDLYLPSLPSIAREFGTSTSNVQLTLSCYLAGFALAQILYGPVSDRMGRRPVVLFGLGLYALATAACAVSPSIGALVVARFFQALGGAGPIVLGRAMVRDMYEGPRAGVELARMSAIMGLVPAVAPVAGGLIEATLGWRASFGLVLAVGAVLLAGVIALLPETLRLRSPARLTVGGILGGFGVLLRNAHYRVDIGLCALAYSGLFCFISGSSFVLQGVYGLSPLLFGFSFGTVVIGFVAGSLLAPRLVRRRGLRGTIAVGAAVLAAAGVAMLAAVLVGLASPLALVVPMMAFAAGVGFVMPQAAASAMTPFPERAGAAASLLGLVQMTLAALLGAALGLMIGGSALPLAGMIAGVGVTALALSRLRPRTG